MNSLLLGRVHHVQRDDHRPSDLDELHAEIELPLEARGVEHEQREVGQGSVGLDAQEHVAHDHFVRRARTEAVGARQIQHLDRASPGERAEAGLLLHGHAGIVGDLLPQSRELVEEGGLSAVGPARDRDELASQAAVRLGTPVEALRRGGRYGGEISRDRHRCDPPPRFEWKSGCPGAGARWDHPWERGGRA